MEFTKEQRERYARHFVLKEIGEEGQRKLSEAKVLVIGAGGYHKPCGEPAGIRTELIKKEKRPERRFILLPLRIIQSRSVQLLAAKHSRQTFRYRVPS